MENEIRVEGEVVIMRVLYKNDKAFDVKCDLEDMAILQKYYWVMSKNATSVVCNYRQDGKMVKPTLHKILTDSPFVKFLNDDKLDFRRNNLQPVEKRISTKQIGRYLKGNPFFIHEGGVTFYITDRKGKKTGLVFIIDYEDLDKVIQYTWCINPFSGYVQTKTRGGQHGSKGLYLHRLIMNAQVGDDVDHISHIKIDNRKSNLRLCNRSQNCHNMPMYSNNTTGVKGVSRTISGAWDVQMQIEYKTLRKTFSTFAEAATQRKEWEKQHNPSGLG